MGSWYFAAFVLSSKGIKKQSIFYVFLVEGQLRQIKLQVAFFLFLFPLFSVSVVWHLCEYRRRKSLLGKKQWDRAMDYIPEDLLAMQRWLY